MYSEKVMDHFSNPRNVGQIDNANAVGEVGNAKCGDIMKIYMDIQDDVIKDVKFKTFGCGAAIATSSMATEMVKGKTVDEALALTNKAVMEALDGLPPVKVHCSLLAEEAIHAALFLLKRLFSLQSTITEAKRVKHRLKIIVTSVTRNVTIQTNNPIKYNIKTDKTLLFCLFLRL